MNRVLVTLAAMLTIVALVLWLPWECAGVAGATLIFFYVWSLITEWKKPAPMDEPTAEYPVIPYDWSLDEHRARKGLWS